MSKNFMVIRHSIRVISEKHGNAADEMHSSQYRIDFFFGKLNLFAELNYLFYFIIVKLTCTWLNLRLYSNLMAIPCDLVFCVGSNNPFVLTCCYSQSLVQESVTIIILAK